MSFLTKATAVAKVIAKSVNVTLDAKDATIVAYEVSKEVYKAERAARSEKKAE